MNVLVNVCQTKECRVLSKCLYLIDPLAHHICYSPPSTERGRHVGRGVVADTVDLWTQWMWRTWWSCRGSGLVDAVDAVGHGRDEGPGDMERKERVFCSHIGSKNISIF